MDMRRGPRAPGVFGTEEGVTYAVDWFAGGNAVGVYLLSHMHTDHTAGLFDGDSGRAKREWSRRAGSKIVCSAQTKALLVASGVSTCRIEALPLNQPCAVSVEGGRSGPCVTLIDANHCPGSVMFLIQWGNIHNLHTGDFRFDAELHGSEEVISLIEHVEKVFIDTTFCDRSWDELGDFPLRQKSIELLIDLIEKLGKPHVYVAADSYGIEPVLRALHRHFRAPVLIEDIHHRDVNLESKKVWLSWLGGAVEDMRSVVCDTLPQPAGKYVLHACVSKGLSNPRSIWRAGADTLADEPCSVALKDRGKERGRRRAGAGEAQRGVAQGGVLRIKASALWFSGAAGDERSKAVAQRREESAVKQDEYGVWHVLYSNHSSHKEICAFLQPIRNATVYSSMPGKEPCLVPELCSSSCHGKVGRQTLRHAADGYLAVVATTKRAAEEEAVVCRQKPESEGGCEGEGRRGGAVGQERVVEVGRPAGDGDCVLRQRLLQPPTTAGAVADEEVVEVGGGAIGRLAGGGEAAMEVASVLAPLGSAAVTGAGRASLSMPCADSNRYSHEDGGLSRQERTGDDVQENSSSSSSSSSRARGVKRTRLQAEEPAAVDSDLTMVIPPHRSEKCEPRSPHTQPDRCSFLESWGVSPPRSPVPTRRPACAPALGGEGGEEERHLNLLEEDAPALGAPTSRARSIQPVHGDSCQGGGGAEPVACVSPTCRSGGGGGGEQAPSPAWLLALGWSPLKNST